VGESSAVDDIFVATDDQRINDAVNGFGGKCVMTSPYAKSGTDRVTEAARKINGGDIIVNVQGDEPLINPEAIEAVVDCLKTNPDIVCSTAASEIVEESSYRDPNAVKVVLDGGGQALYFSRSPIPAYRDGEFGGALLHIGIYCFRRDFLEVYSSLKPTPLEQAEMLEQLRMLEHGFRIGVVQVEEAAKGIDTPEDLEQVKRILGG
jgi:3-deoxy-manno-octulosonate cytidylyltransferase (CMP-KDO synthetase)